MTITIADGRGALWQWDTGRRVKITDGDGVKQVHYQNKCFGRSVDVDVGDDGTAIIPDELLQDWHPLMAYAYVTDDAGGYTKVQVDFAVHKRARPADYVYTPTERAGFDKLRAEIGDLSALQTTSKDNLVTAINEVARTGSGAEVFYIDLAGNYPNYTCPVAMADIKAAYAAGKVLECRCTLVAYTVTLPLFVPMPAANTWIFSGSGALESMGFDAQSFTVAITANGVAAQGTTLNKILRISVGHNVYLYDGSAPVNVVIDDDSSDAVLYTAQTLTDAQKQQARENVDAAIADFMVDATLNFGGIARLDKTFEQIKEAITAGKNPVVHVSGLDAIESYLQLAAYSVSFVRFVGMAMNDERDCAITFELIVKSDIATYSISYLPAADTYGFMPQVSMLSLPTKDMQIATKKYVDDKEFILQSTTPGSSKKFKITVDDSGALSAVEVTE